MILNKRSSHNFETNDIELEITEFPFDSGEELHLEIKAIEDIKYFGLMGNPENNQTLSFRIGDAHIWLKWDYHLLPLLEKEIARYKDSWSEYYQSLSKKGE